MAAAETVEDHVDEFFVDLVLMGLARELRLVLLGLNAALAQQTSPPRSRIEELYLRLTWIFNVSTETFERKKYASLSHEANKAMNLNAYISLMGHTWHKETTADGVVLRKVADGVVPDATARSWTSVTPTYLLTLDADSLLLRDYCLRLVYFLESAGQRARRGHPDAVLLLPRRPDPHRAHRRSHHRPPAHPAPGHDATTVRPSGWAPTPSSASGPWRTSSRWRPRWLRDPDLHPGPHRHRGHRIQHRPRPARLDPGELPGTAQLQRHAARTSARSWCSAGAGRTAAC